MWMIATETSKLSQNLQKGSKHAEKDVEDPSAEYC